VRARLSKWQSASCPRGGRWLGPVVELVIGRVADGASWARLGVVLVAVSGRPSRRLLAGAAYRLLYCATGLCGRQQPLPMSGGPPEALRLLSARNARLARRSRERNEPWDRPIAAAASI